MPQMAVSNCAKRPSVCSLDKPRHLSPVNSMLSGFLFRIPRGRFWLLKFNSSDLLILHHLEVYNKTPIAELAALSGYHEETVQNKLTLWRGTGVILAEQARVNWGVVWPDAYAALVRVKVVRVDVLEGLAKGWIWKQVHKIGRKALQGFVIAENVTEFAKELDNLRELYHCSDIEVLPVEKTWW